MQIGLRRLLVSLFVLLAPLLAATAMHAVRRAGPVGAPSDPAFVLTLASSLRRIRCFGCPAGFALVP